MTSPKTRNILDDAADLLRKHAPAAYSPVPGPPTNPELKMDLSGHDQLEVDPGASLSPAAIHSAGSASTYDRAAEVLPLHITITVHGGCVVDVDGLPDDATYTIDDRDIQAHQ